jgi:hypothetical protein
MYSLLKQRFYFIFALLIMLNSGTVCILRIRYEGLLNFNDCNKYKDLRLIKRFVTFY